MKPLILIIFITVLGISANSQAIQDILRKYPELNTNSQLPPSTKRLKPMYLPNPTDTVTLHKYNFSNDSDLKVYGLVTSKVIVSVAPVSKLISIVQLRFVPNPKILEFLYKEFGKPFMGGDSSKVATGQFETGGKAVRWRKGSMAITHWTVREYNERTEQDDQFIEIMLNIKTN